MAGLHFNAFFSLTCANGRRRNFQSLQWQPNPGHLKDDMTYRVNFCSIEERFIGRPLHETAW